jgi:hypothetical protein
MAPPVPEKVYLEHVMPGRARLRVPKPRTPQRVRRVAARAGRMHRVKNVSTNAATGSLLLTFKADDPIDMIVDDLRIAGLELITPERPQLGAVQTQSTGAAVVRRVLSTCNAKLHLATRGNFDMRLAVPAVYTLLAIRSYRRQKGRLLDAPWYQLAWWAFDSFFKLHEEANPPVASGSRGRIVS